MTSSLFNLMSAVVALFVVIAAIIIIYLFKLHKTIGYFQKQNIDFQLYEKRFNLLSEVKEHFNSQLSNINASKLSLADKFEIKSYSESDFSAVELTIRNSLVLFPEEFYQQLISLNQKTEDCVKTCLKSLKEIKVLYSRYAFAFQDDYEVMSSKIKAYFNDYFQEIIDTESLRKYLNSVDAEEVFTIFSRLENEVKTLQEMDPVKVLNELFEQECLSYLK